MDVRQQPARFSSRPPAGAGQQQPEQAKEVVSERAQDRLPSRPLLCSRPQPRVHQPEHRLPQVRPPGSVQLAHQAEGLLKE